MNKVRFNKLFAVLLALAMIIGTVPANVQAEELKKTTISDAKAGTQGESYLVEGVITMIEGKNIYLQDSTGGIALYLSEAATGVELGDTIKASGKLSEYNGLPQLGSATFTKTSGMKLEAKKTTLTALSAKDLCTYVELSGLDVVEVYDNNGAYSSPNVTVSDGTTSMQIYKAVVAKNGDAWAIKAGDKVTVKAAVSCYKETIQLRNTLTSEITLFTAEDAAEASLLKDGKSVVIYCEAAEGVLGEASAKAINPVSAELDGIELSVGNGARVFTIEENGDYYRFYNETDGYLCSNGTGNNSFYSKDAGEEADWKLIENKTGYFFESRAAKYKENSQFLEYYSDSFKTYSKYSDSDASIYTFSLFAAPEEVTAGIVNIPSVIAGALPSANCGEDYKFGFSVDAIFGVKNLTVKLGSEELEYVENNGVYSVSIPAKLITGEKLTVSVAGTDETSVKFSESFTISVVDQPIFKNMTPAAQSQTEAEKKPVISVEVSNAGNDPTITMTVAGKEVKPSYKDGVISYTPSADMADGRTNVTVTVTRADGVSAIGAWNFTVGKATEQLYFGQLHSHTAEYSDGAGTLAEGLDYIASLPESANVDFVAFTDHSNYFDTTAEANPEGALYDMSLATAYSNEMWAKYKGDIESFNKTQSDVVAIAGFEMTWSGGPGHINTFNTEGIVSRNNSTLNNKTDNAGLKAYYALLSEKEGADSISQFNHPGSTFGTFIDFSFWDAVVDTRIQLVEVGNGEGAIGAGGYYPSYEYYTMALDKGWHVAPTNNQDNHKGKWGNGNEARDVVLTDNFSEEGIYEAIREYKVYATEDKNLEIYYTVNGLPMGSQIEEIPEKLDIKVQAFDPDLADSISKVEVIVNSGKVAHMWDAQADLAKGEFTVSLAPEYSYYYIRVTEGDGDLAVTAPVWVGETLKLGISSVATSTSTPVTDEELTITTTIFNSEEEAANVKKVVYTTNGSVVLGTDSKGYTVPSLGTFDIDFAYTPETAKVMNVTATVYIEQGGVEYVYSMDLTLDVMDAEDLVYIGVDASHYNEYVAGNYKDSMGNFGELAAGYLVRLVELYTSEDLIDACNNEKYKAIIMTAPSRRLADAQANPGVYSEDEIVALKKFAQGGGTLVLAGWSDYYENYDVIISDSSIKHMAVTQNSVLEAIGSSLRITDDATHDDTLNGGQTQRLYFSSYNFDSFLLNRVELDEEYPNDVMYTERYSQYGGATIHVVDKNGNPTTEIPANVTPVVFGHAGTYSKDSDNDGIGGASVPKYAYADGDDRLMVLATETLTWDDGTESLVIVAGAAFMSNFEVQATIADSGSEKNYSNYKICENLCEYINPVKITDIATVQKQTEAGIKYTIEGIVTSNASGYDKDTAFFDCIYVQDETAGVCCFPVAGNYKVGDKVRITGIVDFYQGERELSVSSITVIGSGSVAPENVTAKQINDGSVVGSLVTLKGNVESFELQNGLVQTILVKDKSGEVARVFIDGYITTDADVKGLKKGASITVTGIASYDNTFDGAAPRIRISNRADVLCGAYVPVASGNDIVYYVADGDTLGTIAVNFYGNNANRVLLYNYNKEAFAATGGKLVPGMGLLIPEVLGGADRIPECYVGEGETLYVVKLGDTLGSIAKKFFGSSSKYVAIFERNRDRIFDANKIYEGQKIVIPEE